MAAMRFIHFSGKNILGLGALSNINKGWLLFFLFWLYL